MKSILSNESLRGTERRGNLALFTSKLERFLQLCSQAGAWEQVVMVLLKFFIETRHALYWWKRSAYSTLRQKL